MGRFSQYPDERFEEQSRQGRPWGGQRFRNDEWRERGDENRSDRYSQSYGGDRFRDPEQEGSYGRQDRGREGSQFGRQFSDDDWSRPYQRGERPGERWDSRGYGGSRSPSSQWGRDFEGYASDESWGSGGGRQYPRSFDPGSYGGQGSSFGLSSYGQGSSYGQQGFGRSYGQGSSPSSSEREMRRAGGHRGKGPKGYQRTDERLREMICERLTEDDSIDASDISVTVSNGNVTLEGTVDSRQAKYDAEECAEQCGAREITNNLRVARGSGQSSAMGSSLDSGQSSMSTASSGSTGGEPASSGSAQRGGSRSSSSKGH